MKEILLFALLFAQGIAQPAGRTGAITGLLPGADGQPAAGIRVAAIAVPAATGQGTGEANIASITQTDASGHYRLEDVMPGRYYIVAGLADFPTYFPGVTRRADATVETVTAGATLEGRDFTMLRVRGPQVLGRIIPKENRPGPSTLQVTMTDNIPSSRTIGNTPLIRSVSPDPDGSFRFTNVLPGNYTIQTIPAFAAQPQRVAVDERDVAVEVPLLPTKAVKGQASVEGGIPLPSTITFSISDRGASSAETTTAVVSPDNGSFTITVPEGESRVALKAPPKGYVLKSITSGGASLLAETLVANERDSAEIRVTLGEEPDTWVKVTGRVIGLDPGAMTPAIVTLNLGATEGLVKPDGSFEILKALPGYHQLRVSTHGGDVITAPYVTFVPDTGQDGMVVRMPREREIIGQLIIESAGTLTTFSLLLIGDAGNITVRAALQADGSFKAYLPEGEFRIAVSGIPNSSAVKSFTYGSVNLRNQPLKIEPDTSSAELRITIGASVSDR